MELYINSDWTKRYENAYIAEAIAWLPFSDHATFFSWGRTPREADVKLIGALRELKLVPETSINEQQKE